MKGSVRTGSALLLMLAAACSEPAAPAERASVHLFAGGDQYGTPGAQLSEPLQVIVTDEGRRPRADVTVRWRVTRGSGASLGTATTTTGTDGIAATTLRLGPDTGRYEVRASVDAMLGDAARFEIRAVRTPTIAAIEPAIVSIPDTITITGDNFSPAASENVVRFDGIPGQVVAATRTQLRVVVPACLPTRSVIVTASLGSVASAGQALQVNGDVGAEVLLQPGGSVRLTGAAMACQRLPGAAGAGYLIIPQNVSALAGTILNFEATGVQGGGPVITVAPGSGTTSRSFADEWESRLRASERAFRRTGVDALSGFETFSTAAPEVGDRRRFKVLNRDNRFSDVEAEVRHISERAILYVDRSAPQNGLTSADLQTIGNTFDSRIWPVDVQHFGSPSDIDGNGKVIILLTPVVNELTPAGSSSFIGGFFYACDLMSKENCSGSNRSEVFYLLVPDPAGSHGNIRTRTTVINAILPILAHELQHMINYSVRGSLDALWLSEGLAHMAEDLVADAYAQAGDTETARLYRTPNYNRAALFLRDTATSLVSEELPGSVEQRGAAWLLLKYLQGHHGNQILQTMTSSPRSSADNVAHTVGKAWDEVLSNWAVALWADDAPQLPPGIDARYTFPNINLRRDLTASAYPLFVTSLPFSDFAVRGALRASAQRFLHVQAAGTATPEPLAVSVTGAWGRETDSVQVTIFRVK